MELKYIFLLIAILATGMIIIPSIYSTFTGQHSFIDTGNAGNATDTGNCLKCHSDIRNELGSSIYHTTLSCKTCHFNNPNLDIESHDKIIIPKCLDCHRDVIQYLDKDSHKPLILNSNISNFKKGENEACISCHTTKSLQMEMTFFNTYQFKAINSGKWQMSNFSKDISDISSLLVSFNGTSGIHKITSLSDLKCEKCHTREKDHLESSDRHNTFSCGTCHQLDNKIHSSNIPLCIDCHFYILEGNNRIAPSRTDAHYPFVFNANNSGEKNLACLSCHSSFNNNITFIRPEFIEWDVRNNNVSWLIENLSLGPNKEIKINKKLDGKIHNISIDNGKNCIYCHDDIKDAVISGGHSNEQWTKKHGFGLDMNTYCRSCHQPYTSNDNKQSPYPAYPFNSIIHGSMRLSCLDCHIKSDLYVNMNGDMRKPLYDSKKMGHIEDSISNQNQFIQSYLCIACKNTGNPSPRNNSSIHFKILTEPQTTIYINGKQRYP